MKKENNKIESVAFGGGCFWCSEAIFLTLRGVIHVTSGYAGGKVENPNYEMVSMGETGHAEVILVEYNPAEISFSKLLEVFFESHDPTSINRQGNDVGTQYRSILLYTNLEQKKLAESFVAKLSAEKKYSKPIVTEIVPLAKFYPAEQYHQEYYANHSEEGYSKFIIEPKVEKIRKEFGESVK